MFLLKKKHPAPAKQPTDACSSSSVINLSAAVVVRVLKNTLLNSAISLKVGINLGQVEMRMQATESSD